MLKYYNTILQKCDQTLFNPKQCESENLVRLITS